MLESCPGMAMCTTPQRLGRDVRTLLGYVCVQACVKHALLGFLQRREHDFGRGIARFLEKLKIQIVIRGPEGILEFLSHWSGGQASFSQEHGHSENRVWTPATRLLGHEEGCAPSRFG